MQYSISFLLLLYMVGDKGGRGGRGRGGGRGGRKDGKMEDGGWIGRG